jgi:hypothetical protein
MFRWFAPGRKAAGFSDARGARRFPWYNNLQEAIPKKVNIDPFLWYYAPDRRDNAYSRTSILSDQEGRLRSGSRANNSNAGAEIEYGLHNETPSSKAVVRNKEISQ